MKQYLSLILAIVMLIIPASSLAENTPSAEQKKIRTIVTADWLDDDQCSLVRYLLYANEFETLGFIADNCDDNFYEFNGVSVENKDIVTYFLDAYAKDYENLCKHADGYPTPEYLYSINVNGQLEKLWNGHKELYDTEGSDLIKKYLLDDSEEMLFIQCWGGTGTVGAALQSIEKEYKGTEQWDSIYNKVIKKAVIYHDLGQDSVMDEYILPNWPDLNIIMTHLQFQAMVPGFGSILSDEEWKYYRGQWVSDNITHEGSALSDAYYSIKGTHKTSAVEGDADAQESIAEGDTPNFLYILDVGLRQLENPYYGGWGGRYQASYVQAQGVRSGAQNRWRDPLKTGYASFWVDTADDGDLWKPLYRWTAAFQNDFAARMEWTAKSYEDANHAPSVSIVEGLDLTAQAGDTITLTAVTSDPDGDEVSVAFWQYGDVDTYGGSIDLIVDGNQASFVVPDDAILGKTIHIIVEAQDNGADPMTRYQRVIVTMTAE